jgi:sugar phosphate isomerase/epimerase
MSLFIHQVAYFVKSKSCQILHYAIHERISGCQLGKGLVDLPGMLAAVRAAGRSPNVLVEGWMDRLDDEAATLAQEEAWVRQGVAYLRRLLNE